MLVALNVARSLELAAAPAGSPARAHLLLECMRLAFAETAWHVADPAFYRAPVAELLSEAFGRDRARLVDPRRAMASVTRSALAGSPAGDDTVYLCAADAEGNACSFINSTFTGFGTGIVAGGCGLLAAEPRLRLPARPAPPQPPRAAQAALPHDHPGHGHA